MTSALRCFQIDETLQSTISRVFISFKAPLTSPASTSAASAAAAKFSSSSSTTTAAKSATSKAAHKTPKKSTTSPKVEKPATPRTTTRPSGIFKIAPVSPALGRFLGAQQASRTDAVKQIWNYIKSHNLQNPDNKREIFCDEKLKTIFNGKEKVGFLEIGKMLSRHFVKSV
ncbi:upstream activation factor subunit UAF30-like [Hibiscus syriacus]|uniref:upstream activation factor subunit UAF30-like n=1 Tax=Hibiscus syriacus TaxID=106335 RepID=UPI0019238591|nr:upstream activation factor subunit UAF30-like [Hibiscus syriacus]